MEKSLRHKACLPCKKGTPALVETEIVNLKQQLKPEWKVIESHHLEREFSFPNFKTALDFTNAVATLAEQEGHHPDIFLGWGKVKVTLWTHKINGLSENDFILAAKIDQL